VVSLMASLYVLALFSQREGAVPRVILEAMAMGVVVVAADLGGIVEAIEDGVDGLIVPAGDNAAFESAVRSLLSSPSRFTALSARAQSSVTRFDRAAQIDAFCREVVALAS